MLVLKEEKGFECRQILDSSTTSPNVCFVPNDKTTLFPLKESPHKSMHCYIEMAWAFSTGLGILLFLAEIAILCWVKFGFFREHGEY